MDITLWIIFTFKKYIWLNLYISYSNIQKYPTNIEKIKHMEYICEKTIYVTKFKNLHTCLKTKVVGGMFGWISFVVNDNDIHQLNIWPFRSLKLLVENPLKKCLLHFLNNKKIILKKNWEKTIT
jgi:hypothetical protein